MLWDEWCEYARTEQNRGEGEAGFTIDVPEICLGHGYNLVRCYRTTSQTVYAIRNIYFGQLRLVSSIPVNIERTMCLCFPVDLEELDPDNKMLVLKLSQSLFRAAFILGEDFTCGQYNCLASSLSLEDLLT